MKLKFVSALLVIACVMTGCGGGGGYGGRGNNGAANNGGGGGNGTPPTVPAPPTTPPPPASVDFTAFAKSVVAAGEGDVPSDVDAVTFNFDREDDQMAYDDVLPSGS